MNFMSEIRAEISSKMACGGLTQAKPAISEVQEICDLVTKFTLRRIGCLSDRPSERLPVNSSHGHVVTRSTRHRRVFFTESSRRTVISSQASIVQSYGRAMLKKRLPCP